MKKEKTFKALCINNQTFFLELIKFKNLRKFRSNSENRKLPIDINCYGKSISSYFDLRDKVSNWNITSLKPIHFHKFSMIDYFNKYKKLVSIDDYIFKHRFNNYVKQVPFFENCYYNKITLKYIDSISAQLTDLEWSDVSFSNSIKLTEDFIEKYQNKLDFKLLSSVENLPWSSQLILKYISKWDYNALIYNKKIQWNCILIYKLKHHFRNPNQYIGKIWSQDFLIKMKNCDIWNWSFISSNTSIIWDNRLVILCSSFWNWNELESNETMCWDKYLVGKYYEHLSFEGLSKVGKFWDWESIELYRDRINWSLLSSNKFMKWTDDIIENNIDKWDWEAMSGNSALPWSIDFITKYEDKLNFDKILRHSKFDKSIEFSRMFSTKLNWKGYIFWGSGGHYKYVPSLVSKCTELSLNVELLEKFSKDWKTGHFHVDGSESITSGDWVSYSYNNFLTIEILRKYKNCFDWEVISSNINIPWSVNLILEFQPLLNFNLVAKNTGAWALVFDNLIEERFVIDIFDNDAVKSKYYYYKKDQWSENY